MLSAGTRPIGVAVSPSGCNVHRPHHFVHAGGPGSSMSKGSERRRKKTETGRTGASPVSPSSASPAPSPSGPSSSLDAPQPSRRAKSTPASPKPVSPKPRDVAGPISRALASRRFAALALAFHFLLAFTAATRNSPTFDEIAHLPAGVSYWRFREVRLNPEHPALPKLWAAVPAALLGDPEWREDDPEWIEAAIWKEVARDRTKLQPTPEVRNSLASEWGVGVRFLYEWNRSRLGGLFASAHAMMALLSVVGGAILWLWTRRAFGGVAAGTATALYAFCPTILGHAPLVHTDVPAAVTSLAALWATHAWLGAEGTWRAAPGASLARSAMLGAAIASSLLSKYSQVLLLAFAPLALAGCVVALPPARRAAFALDRAVGLVVAGVFVALVMELFHRAFFGESFAGPWLSGFLVVSRRVLYDSGDVFLMGRFEKTALGYFIVALAVKLTFVALVALVAGVADAARDRGERNAPAPVGLLLGWIVFFGLALTIVFPRMGVRHAIPLLPPAFMLAGRLAARLLERGGAWPRAAAGALALHAGSAFLSWPDHVGYMNPISRTKGKDWFLVDSNLDWGQNLPRLAALLERIGASDARLCLLTLADPAYYGLKGAPFEPIEIVGFPSGTTVAVSLHRVREYEGLEVVLRDWKVLGELDGSIRVYRKP